MILHTTNITLINTTTPRCPMSQHFRPHPYHIILHHHNLTIFPHNLRVYRHLRLSVTLTSSMHPTLFLSTLRYTTHSSSRDTWRASMNVGSKRPIAWKHCRHASSRRFYLHCRIEETGSPGIICIVCHQVLCHPSEHGTSSMQKNLLANAHIAK